MSMKYERGWKKKNIKCSECITSLKKFIDKT